MSNTAIAWIFLIMSILSEVIGTVALKHSSGFTKITPTFIASASFLTAIWLMSKSLKHIEMGIIYAVWAGSATAILAVIDIIIYDETLTIFKLIGILMVVMGVVVLHLDYR